MYLLETWSRTPCRSRCWVNFGATSKLRHKREHNREQKLRACRGTSGVHWDHIVGTSGAQRGAHRGHIGGTSKAHRGHIGHRPRRPGAHRGNIGGTPGAHRGHVGSTSGEHRGHIGAVGSASGATHRHRSGRGAQVRAGWKHYREIPHRSRYCCYAGVSDEHFVEALAVPGNSEASEHCVQTQSGTRANTMPLTCL